MWIGESLSSLPHVEPGTARDRAETPGISASLTRCHSTGTFLVRDRTRPSSICRPFGVQSVRAPRELCSSMTSSATAATASRRCSSMTRSTRPSVRDRLRPRDITARSPRPSVIVTFESRGELTCGATAPDARIPGSRCLDPVRRRGSTRQTLAPTDRSRGSGSSAPGAAPTARLGTPGPTLPGRCRRSTYRQRPLPRDGSASSCGAGLSSSARPVPLHLGRAERRSSFECSVTSGGVGSASIARPHPCCLTAATTADPARPATAGLTTGGRVRRPAR